MSVLPRTLRVEHVMGTVFSIDVRDDVDPAVLDAVVADLHRVDAVFSTYRPHSAVSRLARGEPGPLDPQVREVLALCDAAHRQTGGWFDARAGGRLDPSGVVKGWAVERAGAALTAAGATRWSVNGGGDVQVGAGPEPGRPWRVGVADPARAGALLASLPLEHGGVATSGSAERGAHVLDPRTGRPAAGVRSVTVVGPSLLTADVLATAAVAAGDAAADVLARHPSYAWLLVADDGTRWAGGGWPG